MVALTRSWFGLDFLKVKIQHQNFIYPSAAVRCYTVSLYLTVVYKNIMVYMYIFGTWEKLRRMVDSDGKQGLSQSI